MREQLLSAAGLGLLGLIVGSFVATLVLRWPQGRSVMRGRSACDGCGRQLAPVELVPVFSFVALRGHCRGCGARIDRRHVAIEVVAALVGVTAGWTAPGIEGVAGAVFGWLLLALATLDLAAWWLPDRLTALLAAGGLAAGAAGVMPPLTDRLIGGLVGLASLWLVGAAYRAVRHREGLGGGDPKLFGAIGLWVGWRLLAPVLLLACLVGIGIVAWRRLTGRAVSRYDAVPLGALLAIAAYPAWLAMIAWRP